MKYEARQCINSFVDSCRHKLPRDKGPRLLTAWWPCYTNTPFLVYCGDALLMPNRMTCILCAYILCIASSGQIYPVAAHCGFILFSYLFFRLFSPPPQQGPQHAASAACICRPRAFCCSVCLCTTSWYFRRRREHRHQRIDGLSWTLPPLLLLRLLCLQMFLGNENSVYILDKAEDNAATINGHPSWGAIW